MEEAPSTMKKQKKRQKLSHLKTLGQQLLTSRAHINNLPILLNFVSSDSPPQHAVESLLSLQSFFTPVVPELPSSASSVHSNASADPESIYRTWLRSKFDDFIQRLVDLSVSSEAEDALREVVLDAIMEFVKVGNSGKFNSSIYHKLLRAIVQSALGNDDILLDLLVTKYFSYVDVCYFTYISLEKQARTLEEKDDKSTSPEVEDSIQSKTRMDLLIHKMHNLLSRIPASEAIEEKLNLWNPSGIFNEKSNNKEHKDGKDRKDKSQKSDVKVLSSRSIGKKMKLKFTKAWISFLILPLPLDVYKEVLVTLHQAVIPYLSNPIMLCDFLSRSYDIGGVVSVMALSSLYVLMTQHGLEYPNFYNKLYALLEPSIFVAKHRAKFFQLLDSCLKSPLLPAYMAAAFCKKLSRLALFVPPSGDLVIIALVHNLLQRHPSISFLVHREGGSTSTSENSEEDCSAIQDTIKENGGVDHFKNEENDPKDANAMSSSLWEIDTLRHHYSPAVSRFVSNLETDLAARARTAEIAVEDFSCGSYATIFSDEIRRRVKQVPLAFYKTTPTQLFSESDFEGWTFKLKDEEHALVSSNGETTDTSMKRQRVV